ncbi:MAG TPA: MerC domain-containing protein [Thermoanaerobaculia bacterium]|jgi:hypothetical protein|nr:MerC domain-containing protein [Thermoanaerobaculia bacterium]
MTVLRNLERWGGGLSLACAVHCLAMPLLLSLFPLAVATAYLSERLEGALVVGSVLLSAAALCHGFRIHRRRRILLLLAVACGLIAVGRLAAREPLEAALVAGGSFCLAAGNLLNHRLCRSCVRCGADSHAPS